MTTIDASDDKIRKMIRVALVEQDKRKKNQSLKHAQEMLLSLKDRVSKGEPISDEKLKEIESSLKDAGVDTTDISASIGEDPKTQHSYLFTANSPGNNGGTVVGLKDMVSEMVDDISEVDDYVNEIITKIGPKKWRLYSKSKDKTTGKRKNLGTFSSRSAAEDREKQVNYFKEKDK